MSGEHSPSAQGYCQDCNKPVSYSKARCLSCAGKAAWRGPKAEARRAAVRAGTQKKKTHGASQSLAYRSWSSMKTRCLNPRDRSYNRYGAKGITICARWVNSFESFLADMGVRPSPRHTIDRFPDKSGGYWCGKPECPECGPLGRKPNCRWATQQEQQRNRTDNRLVEFNGETLPLNEWAERYGIERQTLAWRLASGMDATGALLTPVKPVRREEPLPPCRNCGRAAKRIVRGRCDACYLYLKRTGRERPTMLEARRCKQTVQPTLF